MFWLVEADRAAAWQRDGGHNPPICRLNLGALHILRFQRRDGGRKVVAHQVQNRAQQFVPCMAAGELTVERVNSGLRRRHGKDEPSLANIHPAESEHMAEEKSVRLWIFTVKQEMRTGNHAAEYIRNSGGQFDLFGQPS